MPLELTPEQQKLMDEADLIMERDGILAGMEANFMGISIFTELGGD